jgi:predicted nucleic acid-binding protein
MGNKPCILVDLNVILDVLQKREPFYDDSAQLLAMIEAGEIEGFVAAHSITTLFYLVSKDQSPATARVILTSLMQFLKIAPVDHDVIEAALNMPYKDFEDAVQMVSAMQCKANFLVTRNIKDYQPAPVTVIQPVELLATL